MGDVPASSDTEYWEPIALELLAVLERGPMSLRAVKSAMFRKGYRVGTTINGLSYLAMQGRAAFDRDAKEWQACKS